MKNILLYAIIVMVTNLISTYPCYAASQTIQTIPSNWRLQQYSFDGDTTVHLFFTPTAKNCGGPYGHLSFTGTVEQTKKFFNLMLVAKIEGKVVTLEYSDTSCTISSFSLDN